MAEISTPLPTGPSPTVYGRVAPDGTVFVITAEGEREVGSWQAGRPEEGLAYYARRFEDLSAEVTLLERRASMDPTRAAASATRLLQSLPTAAVVGDIGSLERRLDVIAAKAGELQAAAAQEKAEQRAAAVAEKTALIEEAERVSTTNDWRKADESLRELVDRWKGMPRLDRKTDDDLWGRLSTARSSFQRRRRAHFAELDEKRKSAQTRKQELIAEAEELSTSKEWGPTTSRFRDLMTEWKAAGGAPKGVEEALWNRFKAAQDEFFRRRNESRAERTAAQQATIDVKKELLAEAEAIDATKDLPGARKRLRDIQRRWETAGPVPRDAAAGLDRRLAAVEDKVRGASENRFRPDPSESPLVQRLEESIAKLEKRIVRTRAAGQEKEAAEAEAALATQRSWLAQATRSGR
ncbi:MAG TPA: DUF349 domain-containing protein [Frankiaceae bacterium]|nr:DUF349 domain-containing protein [Frankiaceae bacterium]